MNVSYDVEIDATKTVSKNAPVISHSRREFCEFGKETP